MGLVAGSGDVAEQAWHVRVFRLAVNICCPLSVRASPTLTLAVRVGGLVAGGLVLCSDKV